MQLSQKSFRTPVEKWPKGNFRKQREEQGISGADKIQGEPSNGMRKERDTDDHRCPKKELQI